MGASYDFWNLECRHPGILESPRFGWFLLITMYRVFFPLSFSLNLISNVKFQNSIIPGIFQEQSGTLEFLLEMTYFLPSSYRVFSPCNFWPWTWFSILDYTHRETLEFPRISLLLPLSKYRVLFLFSIHPSTRFLIF